MLSCGWVLALNSGRSDAPKTVLSLGNYSWTLANYSVVVLGIEIGGRTKLDD